MPSGRRPEIVSTLQAVARTQRPWINQGQPRAAHAPLEENSRARAWPMPLGLAAIVVVLAATGRVGLMERRQQLSPLS